MRAPDTALAALAARIGWSEGDLGLLRLALTHASHADGRPGAVSNERLEFLGDRVLGLIVARQLYAAYPDTGEDGLAPRLNAVVNRQACARAARRLELGGALVLSAAEDRTGGREKEAILADACEAVIAALYLAQGWDAAERLVVDVFADELAAVAHPPRDPKMALQEWAASIRAGVPAYVVVDRSGPDHAPVFVVEARVAGRAPARGQGASKRDAERAAARALLAEAGVDV